MVKEIIIKFRFLVWLSFLPTISWSQHANILIGSQGEPNEPSICINPKNTKQLVGGSNIDNLYTSEDGGLSWKETKLQSSHGVWGDPIITIDTAENFYFLHLSNPPNGNWIDRIVCQRRNKSNQQWTDGGFAGLNGKKAQDKHSVAIDPKTNFLHITWTEFDKYGSKNTSDSSRILYSQSKDLGETWSKPMQINKISGDCIDSDNTTEGAVPAIGPEGQIYVSWAGPEGLVFDKSLDGGKTWLNDDIFVSNIPGGWDYEISGISRCNGLPFTSCDRSGGLYNGNIYINWTDQRNGIDDTDVWLVVSSDGGETWSVPRRVNNDGKGKQQFLTSMAVDQTNGNLWFVFYDRRNHASDETDVYMAVSKDGGQTFENFMVSESSFMPNKGIFFGDYTGITAHNNVVRPIWTRLSDGILSVWTALVDVKSTQTLVYKEMIEDTSVSPNPSTQQAFYSFKLHKTEQVEVSLKNMSGQTIYVLKKGLYPTGKYIEKIDTDKLGLTPGVYFIEKVIGSDIKTTKLVISGKN
ncbi:MAG: T9SS type A sorting domain-containing protein [Saprospiraceae bacterium]|nr:T9SS type A sorting domain-containing protein [Saprospiraceae bacterium]